MQGASTGLDLRMLLFLITSAGIHFGKNVLNLCKVGINLER